MSDEDMAFWIALRKDGNPPLVFWVGEFDDRNIEEIAAGIVQLRGKEYELVPAETAKFNSWGIDNVDGLEDD